jgi:uncharacterized membrane protein
MSSSISVVRRVFGGIFRIMFILLATAIVLYAIFITFVSRAGGKIDDGLGGFIFNGVGAVVPIVVFLAMKASHAKGMLPATKNGVLYSVLAGVAIGLFTLVVMRIFQKGSLGYVMPIIYGGAVVLSSLAGWFLFSATVNALQIAGILLVVAGIVLVGISKTA